MLVDDLDLDIRLMVNAAIVQISTKLGRCTEVVEGFGRKWCVNYPRIVTNRYVVEVFLSGCVVVEHKVRDALTV